VLLLVHDPSGERDEAPAPRRRLPHFPWRPLAWFAAFCWLLFAAGAIGGLAGYVLLLAAIALGCWRVDRWLSTLYWGGLREVQR
jgi:hypothetical protein